MERNSVCPIVLTTETKRSLKCEVKDLPLCWERPDSHLNLIFHTFPVDPSSREAEFRSRAGRPTDLIHQYRGRCQ